MGFLGFAMVALTAVQETPPTMTVSSSGATFNADFVIFEPAVPLDDISIRQGVPLTDKRLIASYDGVEPIVVDLPLGEYAVTAFGYPSDRMNPQRVEVIFNVVISGPDREAQIRDALVRYSVHSFETQQAINDLQTLNPTAAEIRAAFVPPAASP